jgi:hypothetical protein
VLDTGDRFLRGRPCGRGRWNTGSRYGYPEEVSSTLRSRLEASGLLSCVVHYARGILPVMKDRSASRPLVTEEAVVHSFGIIEKLRQVAVRDYEAARSALQAEKEKNAILERRVGRAELRADVMTDALLETKAEGGEWSVKKRRRE